MPPTSRTVGGGGEEARAGRSRGHADARAGACVDWASGDVERGNRACCANPQRPLGVRFCVASRSSAPDHASRSQPARRTPNDLGPRRVRLVRLVTASSAACAAASAGASASMMVTSTVAVRVHVSRFLPRSDRRAVTGRSRAGRSNRPGSLASMPTDPTSTPRNRAVARSRVTAARGPTATRAGLTLPASIPASGTCRCLRTASRCQAGGPGSSA